MAMMRMAEFACLSPLRLGLCRYVIPDEMGTGATPQSMAKDVSDLSLSRLPPTVTISWAADWAYAAQGLVGPRVAVEPHPLVDPPLPQMLGVGKRLAVDESPLRAVAGRLDHGVVVRAALLRRGPLDALANPLPRPS